MLTDQQKAAIQAATLVLQMAGITPWFEARIIKDSSKRLNGRRLRTGGRTDLDSVLKVAESKRVGMLPNMRLELRMYATAAGSRAVFLGQELPPAMPKGAPLKVDVPILGVINVDNPRDPRHRDWGNPPPDAATNRLLQDYFRDQPPITGLANFSPSKNVERLIAEGASEALIRQAQDKWFRAPLARMRTVAQHTCDAAGPMRQRDPSGPFITTCSMCGEFNDSE